ncbi:hypothetical protein B0H14DRAFT_3484265 [Mycena olivaceomarginata]|nr:hypothetical protein B0H14DRAFT_3484265 [Mycena olivaceomarginata]
MVTSKKARRGTAAQPRLALTALDTVAQSRARGWRRGSTEKKKNQHVCALLHGLRWIALAVGGVCPDLDANPRAWDRVEVAEQEGEQKDDRTRTASTLPPIQDDEDDSGEIPMVPAPGPIPESYPSDDEDLDYIDSSELPDGGSGVDSDSEVPSAASPPGTGIARWSLARPPGLDANAECMIPSTGATCAGKLSPKPNERIPN